ncbi:uncharacterized protein RHOBADRAFT_39941 [Rhodotorula graminis WP1]|uniref:FAD-binding domain-containing protein n=1 Tax=Rhodotorula graminis (strain WP1) TaxID=578459 RepID=A0A0P9EXN0_RHOGW|nr:uncharacterized protein RHOBADRAFT_39941 [Rhodotorula graminis WP1]KPV71896.1 hypothetical protein RHOBADRAFT_39941 [Rhodotorula graminis WP1]
MPPSADVQTQPSVIDSIKRTVAHVESSTPTKERTSSPADIATAFCASLQSAFDAKDVVGIERHFTDDGSWRDILTIDFDMNSLKRAKGEIKQHLDKYGVPEIRSLKVIKPHDAVINKDANWLQAFTTFETADSRGKGFLRLRESTPGSGDWRAFTFFTALWEVKGHEEFAGHRRPLGAEHGTHDSSENWLDRRQKQIRFEGEDPTVLIVGGGQNGLMLAARLGAIGIKTLVVEKNGRVGDSWRKRYHTLCLHDPVWADHFAYMQFPKTWPIYTPKDKLANYMEEYASQMELNIWLQSTIERNPTYDEQTKQWTVRVKREGQDDREMHVNHLVLASGFSGEPRLPSFPRDEFKGYITHSSGHAGCHGKDWAGKKAVVIGCCNSGHDIAADFYEHGVDTTIVQRSSTYVMSSEHGIPELLNGVYEEDGPPLDDADIMLTSLPVDLLAEFHVEAGKRIAIKDKKLLEDLEKAGFKHNPYPGSLFIKYFRDGGGYYIDVGCSRLIADGKIKIKQGVEVEKLTEKGVLFKDGTLIEADMIVMATGYTSQRETVRRIISDDVAERLGSVWGADAQGEIPGVWRYSGVDRFWLQSGNLFQARCYSKHLAMQIQLIELGLRDTAPDAVKYKHIHDPRF